MNLLLDQVVVCFVFHCVYENCTFCGSILAVLSSALEILQHICTYMLDTKNQSAHQVSEQAHRFQNLLNWVMPCRRRCQELLIIPLGLPVRSIAISEWSLKGFSLLPNCCCCCFIITSGTDKGTQQQRQESDTTAETRIACLLLCPLLHLWRRSSVINSLWWFQLSKHPRPQCLSDYTSSTIFYRMTMSIFTLLCAGNEINEYN